MKRFRPSRIRFCTWLHMASLGGQPECTSLLRGQSPTRIPCSRTQSKGAVKEPSFDSKLCSFPRLEREAVHWTVEAQVPRSSSDLLMPWHPRCLTGWGKGFTGLKCSEMKEDGKTKMPNQKVFGYVYLKMMWGLDHESGCSVHPPPPLAFSPPLGGVPCAVHALCARCAKSRPFSTTGRQFFGCRIAAGYYCHCVSL